MSLKDFGKKLFKAYSENAVSDSSAQLSYYLLFSLFPFLFFLVTLTAYLPIRGTVNDMMERLSQIIPDQAYGLIKTQLDVLLNEPRPKLLGLGLFIAIYSASRGVDAMRTALNRAYKVAEGRSFFKTNAIAIGMTLLGTAMVVASFTAIILGGKGGEWLFSHLQLGAQFLVLWGWLRWPLSAVVITFTAAIGYYFLPDVKQQFKFITPGSVLGTVVWVLGTYGFTFYTEHFSKNNVTYGSIGGVIILMTWFYLSGLIFIVGGVINAILEHASRDGKAVGAKVEGAPAATAEQQLAAQVPGAAKSRSTASKVWSVFKRGPTHPV